MEKEKAIKISKLIAEIALWEATKVSHIGWGDSDKAAASQKKSSEKQQELAELLTA